MVSEGNRRGPSGKAHTVELQKQVKLNRTPVFNNWLKEEKRVVKEPELRGKQECKTRAYVDEGVGNSVRCQNKVL